MSAPDTPESVRALALALDDPSVLTTLDQEHRAAAMLKRYAAVLPVIEAALAVYLEARPSRMTLPGDQPIAMIALNQATWKALHMAIKAITKDPAP